LLAARAAADFADFAAFVDLATLLFGASIGAAMVTSGYVSQRVFVTAGA
jgi:hypothetical protein